MIGGVTTRKRTGPVAMLLNGLQYRTIVATASNCRPVRPRR